MDEETDTEKLSNFAWDHSASQWQSQNTNLGKLAPDYYSLSRLV